MIDFYDLVPLTNPRLSARLESATLNIDYTFDKNVKAVFLPIWTFMRQFDYYKGRDVARMPYHPSIGIEDGSVWIDAF